LGGGGLGGGVGVRAPSRGKNATLPKIRLNGARPTVQDARESQETKISRGAIFLPHPEGKGDRKKREVIIHNYRARPRKSREERTRSTRERHFLSEMKRARGVEPGGGTFKR